MSESIDIIIVLPDFKLGGAQKVVSILIQAWLAQGKKISLVTLSDSAEDFMPMPEGCKRVGLSLCRHSTGALSAVILNSQRIFRLRQCIKNLNGTVVLSLLTTTNILTLLATRGLACKVVISERSDPRKVALASYWIILLKRLYRFADKVVTNNKGVLTWLSAWVPRSKLVEIANPILPIDSSKLSQPLILVVAQLRYEKGIDILIEAFLIFSKNYPNWRLGIVGDGSESVRLKALTKENSNINFYGRQMDVTTYYQRASIYVQPSRHEGMPNAMLEAMGAGLPVIVSDASPGPLEYVKHGTTGLVFSSENQKELAQRLVELAEDADYRAALGMKVKQLLKRNSLKAVMGEWERCLFEGSNEVVDDAI